MAHECKWWVGISLVRAITVSLKFACLCLHVHVCWSLCVCVCMFMYVYVCVCMCFFCFVQGLPFIVSEELLKVFKCTYVHAASWSCQLCPAQSSFPIYFQQHHHGLMDALKKQHTHKHNSGSPSPGQSLTNHQKNEINTTMRCHLTPVRITTIKRQTIAHVDWMQRKGNAPTLPVGM